MVEAEAYTTDRNSRSEDEVVIRPAGDLVRLDWAEYYRYRHLLVALIWREIRLQFDQMYLGVIWACMRPLLYVTIFVVFRNLSNANTYVTIPYVLYVYSGLILWYYVVETSMETANCVRRDAHLITKVYYPRLLTPLVSVIARLVGLGLALAPMIVMMIWYRVVPDWRIVLLPFVILQCIALVMGIGALLAAMTLTSRDWERLLSSIFYVGLFVSPVIYAPEMIPLSAQDVYFVNPMAGTLLAFRGCFFAGYEIPWGRWLYSVAFSAAIFLLGVRAYRRAETRFADQL